MGNLLESLDGITAVYMIAALSFEKGEDFLVFLLFIAEEVSVKGLVSLEFLPNLFKFKEL